MTQSTPILVALASEDVTERDRLLAALRREPSLHVIAATTVLPVLNRVVERVHPDVVVICDGGDATALSAAIAEVRRRAPEVRVLACVVDGEREARTAAIVAGASGVVAPDASRTQLTAAVIALAEGLGWVGTSDDARAEAELAPGSSQVRRHGERRLLELVQPVDESAPAIVAVHLRRSARR